MAALRDVKLYLTEEAGQIAVSSRCALGFGSCADPKNPLQSLL